MVFRNRKHGFGDQRATAGRERMPRRVTMGPRRDRRSRGTKFATLGYLLGCQRLVLWPPGGLPYRLGPRTRCRGRTWPRSRTGLDQGVTKMIDENQKPRERLRELGTFTTGKKPKITQPYTRLLLDLLPCNCQLTIRHSET